MGLLSDWGGLMFRLDLGTARDRPGQPVTFEFRKKLPGIEQLEEAGTAVGPVEVAVTITYLEGLYWLEGTVDGRFVTDCARCLERVEIRFGTKLAEKYARGGPGADTEVMPVEGDFIDLTEKIVESVLLALPMKPLCSPDCLGLCAECGQVLNKAACDCRPDGIDPRLAELGRLLNPDKKGVE